MSDLQQNTSILTDMSAKNIEKSGRKRSGSGEGEKEVKKM